MGPWVSPVAGGDFSPLTAPWQGGEAEDGDPAPPSISRMASGSTKLGSRDLRKEICLHGILRGYFLFPSSSPSSCPKFIFGQVGGSLRPEVGNQGTAGEAEGWWQGPATCCHPRAPSPAWLLELVFRGTVPVSPSRAARQNASRPCAVGRARCCPCLAMLGQATRSLPAWLQRAGVNYLYRSSFFVRRCVWYFHRGVCRRVWVRACVAKGSLHLRCACESRGKFQRGGSGLGWGPFFFFF